MLCVFLCVVRSMAFTFIRYVPIFNDFSHSLFFVVAWFPFTSLFLHPHRLSTSSIFFFGVVLVFVQKVSNGDIFLEIFCSTAITAFPSIPTFFRYVSFFRSRSLSRFIVIVLFLYWTWEFHRNEIMLRKVFCFLFLHSFLSNVNFFFSLDYVWICERHRILWAKDFSARTTKNCSHIDKYRSACILIFCSIASILVEVFE